MAYKDFNSETFIQFFLLKKNRTDLQFINLIRSKEYYFHKHLKGD